MTLTTALATTGAVWDGHDELIELHDRYDASEDSDERRTLAAEIAERTEAQAELLESSRLARLTVGFTPDRLREIATEWQEKAAA